MEKGKKVGEKSKVCLPADAWPKKPMLAAETEREREGKNCNEKNFTNRQEKLKTRATQDQKTINNKAKDGIRTHRKR